MYIDRIWPFTTFISRNKHKKNIRLRLYWLRLRVAEAEVQTSHNSPRLNLEILRIGSDLAKTLPSQLNIKHPYISRLLAAIRH